MARGVARPSRALVGAGLEAILWVAPAAWFLHVYVTRHEMPVTAIPAHLLALGALAGALLLARLAWRTVLPGRGGRAGEALAAATLLALVWSYYALVLVGLDAWRRVATTELLDIYVRQLDQVMEVLGLRPAWLMAAGISAWFALAIILYACSTRFDWIALIVRSGTARQRRLAYPLAGAVWLWAAFHAVGHEAMARGEPWSITLIDRDGNYSRWHAATPDFSRRHARIDLRSHSLGEDPRWDGRERAAREAYRPAPAARRSNVVLLIGDALRADHMSLFGYGRDTTPGLKRMAARLHARLARARAACSESSCGLLSLVSGRYVHEFVTAPVTLHEVLERHGYRISLILGGDHTNFFGLRRLYGRVDDYVDGTELGGYVNDDLSVLARVEAMPAWDGQPRLLQIHLMSTHCLGRRAAEHVVFRPVENYCASFTGRPRDAGHLEAAVNHYDNGVRQFDAIVERLLAALERKGYLGDALVMVTGDHGEYLGEHGRLMHARGVHEAVLGIPLAMFAFGQAPRESFARPIASHADMAPTLLSALGMPIPATWTGVPMQRVAGARLAYFQQGREFGIVDEQAQDGPWKYWRDARSGDEQVHHLGRDAGERNNIVRTVAEERLRAWRRATDGQIMRSDPALLAPRYE
jgi:hypothetical protein